MSNTTSDRFLPIQNKAELDQVLSENQGCVLFFWAPWVQPCKQVEDILRQLGEDFPRLRMCKIEAEEVADVSEAYEIEVAPTVVLVQDKVTQMKIEGANAQLLVGEITSFAKQEAKPSTASAAKPKLAAEVIQQSSAAPSNNTSKPAPKSQPIELTGKLKNKLNGLIWKADVMLFMKGTPQAPECGFSARTVELLRSLNIQFDSFNVYSDEEVREGLKVLSNWPTFPQLYVAGELIGGIDILKDMAEMGGVKEEFDAKIQQLHDRLHKLTHSAPVVLFMKGVPDAPECGFSRQMVELLRAHAIEFTSFNILQDEQVRQGLKAYSKWPTFPQLYSNGELLGGLDIVKELAENNELHATLKSNGAK